MGKDQRRLLHETLAVAPVPGDDKLVGRGAEALVADLGPEGVKGSHLSGCVMHSSSTHNSNLVPD